MINSTSIVVLDRNEAMAAIVAAKPSRTASHDAECGLVLIFKGIAEAASDRQQRRGSLLKQVPRL